MSKSKMAWSFSLVLRLKPMLLVSDRWISIVDEVVLLIESLVLMESLKDVVVDRGMNGWWWKKIGKMMHPLVV
jgi:hypothetical protein